MLNKTHVFLCKPENIDMAIVNCGHCTNTFYVPIIGENEPSYCTYCGMKFKFYMNDNKKFNLAGLPISN